MELSLASLSAIWATVLFASIIRTFTGFGFALAAIPILSLFLSPIDSVTLSTLVVFAISLFRLKTFWGLSPIKPMLPLTAMLLVGTALGAYLLKSISVEHFRLVAGLLVVAASIGLSVFKTNDRSENALGSSIAGLISGVMNGLFAMGGPAIIAYTLLTESDARLSRIKIMAILFVATILALISFTFAGLISLHVPIYFILTLPAIYLGDRLGNSLFEKYGERFYRRVALVILFSVGLSSTFYGLYFWL